MSIQNDKFYNSLSLNDKEKYLELQIEFNKSLVNKWYSEILLNDFLEEKNYEDLEHEYHRPCVEGCNDIDEQTKELELELTKVENELHILSRQKVA